jgi:hypothetical protein
MIQPPGTKSQPKTTTPPEAPCPPRGTVERGLHYLLRHTRGVPDARFWTAFACPECCLPTSYGCACATKGGEV